MGGQGSVERLALDKHGVEQVERDLPGVGGLRFGALCDCTNIRPERSRSAPGPYGAREFAQATNAVFRAGMG